MTAKSPPPKGKSPESSCTNKQVHRTPDQPPIHKWPIKQLLQEFHSLAQKAPKNEKEWHIFQQVVEALIDNNHEHKLNHILENNLYGDAAEELALAMGNARDLQILIPDGKGDFEPGIMSVFALITTCQLAEDRILPLTISDKALHHITGTKLLRNLLGVGPEPTLYLFPYLFHPDIDWHLIQPFRKLLRSVQQDPASAMHLPPELESTLYEGYNNKPIDSKGSHTPSRILLGVLIQSYKNEGQNEQYDEEGYLILSEPHKVQLEEVLADELEVEYCLLGPELHEDLGDIPFAAKFLERQLTLQHELQPLLEQLADTITEPCMVVTVHSIDGSVQGDINEIRIAIYNSSDADAELLLATVWKLTKHDNLELLSELMKSTAKMIGAHLQLFYTPLEDERCDCCEEKTFRPPFQLPVENEEDDLPSPGHKTYIH